MEAKRAAEIRQLRGLKNISWLSSRQINRLAAALSMSKVAKHEIIVDDKHSPEAAFILLSGIGRITCCNRRGDRILVIIVAPGLIPGFPPPVPGIRYDFRCESMSKCQVGTVELKAFIDIALGISLHAFMQMAASYLGRWDLVQLRCANYMSYTLEERVALILLELSENFGVKDKRGIHLTIPARHNAIAQMVGASRPRVTEFIIRFERDNLIIRDKGDLIVNREQIESFLSAR